MKPAVSSALAVCLLAGGACAHWRPASRVDASVSPSPGVPWQPTEDARRAEGVRPRPVPEIPPEWKTEKTVLSLSAVVDLALRNNPATRSAWLAARSAAADLGSRESELYPQIELDANLTRQKQTSRTSTGGLFALLQTTYGPSAGLNWLLLDFGGRAADVDEAKQALYAADWRHDASVLDVVLQVELAYYEYENAKAQLSAEQASLDEARRNLDAAQARHDAGVATIADVLQARTALSQSQLALDTVAGQIQTIRGGLATALGLPASYAALPIDVGDLPAEVDVEAVGEAVDDLIARAERDRPDLAAARAEVAKAQARVRSVKSEGLPTLGVVGSANRTYYYHPAGDSYSFNYSGAVQLQIPLFTGFKNSYDLLKAREDAGVSQADFDTLQQRVILQVWTSYFNLKTAAQRVKTSRDLLDSARQSAEVAAGRYKNGVGSILDLLTAQSALASARAQEIQARSDWFQAIAQLAHDTGTFGPGKGEP
jgi:outer membrane protein